MFYIVFAFCFVRGGGAEGGLGFGIWDLEFEHRNQPPDHRYWIAWKIGKPTKKKPVEGWLPSKTQNPQKKACWGMAALWFLFFCLHCWRLGGSICP